MGVSSTEKHLIIHEMHACEASVQHEQGMKPLHSLRERLGVVVGEIGERKGGGSRGILRLFHRDMQIVNARLGLRHFLK